MNLGELKAIVDTWTNEVFVFKCQTFMSPHSYRGWYNELAFEYCDFPLTVSAIKQSVCRAYMEVFTGWKGGEYTYDDKTPIHLSRQGDTNDEEGCDFTELVFAMDHEYRSFNSEVCYNTSMQTNTVTKMTTKRKTAAEKRAEAEALRLQEQQLEEAKFRATYQTRLWKLVYVFVREHPQLLGTSLDLAYEFSVSRYQTVALPFELTESEVLQHVMSDMADVERYVERMNEERRLAEERAEKKSAALAKLTKEERELLGL